MMIFRSRPGFVKALRMDDVEGPAIVQIVSPRMKTLPSAPVIISRMGFAQRSNIQLSNTLKRSVYIYSFGDFLGDLRIEGIAFHGMCGDTSEDRILGIEYVLAYYNQAKASRTATPVKVVVAGSSQIVGVIVGMTTQTVDADGMAHTFTIDVKSLSITPKSPVADISRGLSPYQVAPSTHSDEPVGVRFDGLPQSISGEGGVA